MARGLNPGHEEEHVPDVTTPQGSQSHSVDHGHEARDVNWKQLKIWFIVLALLTGGAQVGVLIGIFLYQKLQPVPHERVLAETELVPPAPRLLPNFIDSGNLRKEEIVGPVEALEIERRRDSLALAGLGLYDREHHLAHVPEADAALVAGEGDGPPAVRRSEAAPHRSPAPHGDDPAQGSHPTLAAGAVAGDSHGEEHTPTDQPPPPPGGDHEAAPAPANQPPPPGADH